MIIQNRDGSLVEDFRPGNRPQRVQQDCYAEVPAHLLDEESSLIDRLIGLAFDLFDARRVTVRVYDTD